VCSMWHLVICCYITVQLPAHNKRICCDKCILMSFMSSSVSWMICRGCYTTCRSMTRHDLNSFKILMVTWKTSKKFCWNTNTACWQLDYIHQKIIKQCILSVNKHPGTWAHFLHLIQWCCQLTRFYSTGDR
jgi:hypothetical protein